MSQPNLQTQTVVVRPSARLVKPWYTLAFILIAVAYGYSNNRADRMDWLMIPPFLLLLWAGWRHLMLRFTKLSITNSKLRYETGVTSRTTRTMEISKVQDVVVNQSLLQRFLGLGDIAVETAGETSRLTMKNIDRPQYIADYILGLAHK